MAQNAFNCLILYHKLFGSNRNDSAFNWINLIGRARAIENESAENEIVIYISFSVAI